MHISKTSVAILVVAASILCGNSICVAQQEPEAAARQAQVDADMAESKIQDIEESEAGSNVAQDIDTAQQMQDQAKIQHQDQKLYHAQERLQAAEEAEDAEDSED
ncbi:MAG: hypothetical protein J0M12_02925 [Deltaproteobacteria bacterium]|nr:hypothetical protein [Deltaproteobacteria bacterium]